MIKEQTQHQPNTQVGSFTVFFNFMVVGGGLFGFLTILEKDIILEIYSTFQSYICNLNNVSEDKYSSDFGGRN